MGPLFFGEPSGPQTQIYGLSEPIREFLESAQESSDAGMTKVLFPRPLPEPREPIPLPPPLAREAVPSPSPFMFSPALDREPVPLPCPLPPGATPPQFPAPKDGLAGLETPTPIGFPGLSFLSEPESSPPAVEERFPGRGPLVPDPSGLPEPSSSELTLDSPFPMTPRPFAVNVPTPPGGTLAQFAAPLDPDPEPSAGPFPRTPRPFPVVAAASGGTRVQFPPAPPGADAAPESGAETSVGPVEHVPATPTSRGLALHPPEADAPVEVEVEVDVELGTSPEPGQPQSPDIGALLLQAADQLDLDDHTGALETVEKVLALDPQNATAHELLQRCESTLLAMFESKLGDLTFRPQVKLKPDEIVWLNLDHRAGFVLSMVDGQISYDDLFTLSSMSRLDTARILVHLVQARAIG